MVFLKINNLLDQCKGCPKNQIFHKGNRVSPEEICKGCAAYSELRCLGNQLDNQERVIELDMTVEEYRRLKAVEKTDTKIAIRKDVSPQTLSKWKREHGVELKGHKSVTKPSSEAPNQAVQTKMTYKLKAANAEITRLNEELEKAKRSDFVIEKEEYQAMNDKLMANISGLTAQLEKATAEVNARKEQVDNLCDDNQQLKKALDDWTPEIENLDKLENEIAELNKQVEQANQEKSDALIDAGKLVQENNDLKQQLEYLRRDYESNKRFANDQYDEARRAKAQLITLEAFVIEKLKPGLVEYQP
jgi:DNA repair exonuclease SbcCD ATPase subunit